MKTIIVIFAILISFSLGYALTVGKRTGFDYGIVVGGHTGLNGSGSTPTPTTDALLLENGDYLLLESGDKLLLE